MRLCLILRSPDVESGGGPAAEDFVTVSRAELDELRARAGRGPDPAGRGDLAEALEARDAAHSREIADRDRRAAELERAYKGALRDRELATSLVGRPLVAGAAAQLIRLWRDDFEAIEEGGEVRVLARDGRGVDRAVADRLAGPEYAHFCLPSSRGGSGALGPDRSPAPPTSPPVGPRTLGEAALIQWREAARSSGPPASAGWGRR